MPGYTIVAVKLTEGMNLSSPVDEILNNAVKNKENIVRAAVISDSVVTARNEFEKVHDTFYVLGVQHEDESNKIYDELNNVPCSPGQKAFAIAGALKNMPINDPASWIIAVGSARNEQEMIENANKEDPEVTYFTAISRDLLKHDLDQIKELARSILL